MQDLVPNPIVKDLFPVDDEYAVMICGAPAFNEDMARQFRAMGVPAERIIYEDFKFRP